MSEVAGLGKLIGTGRTAEVYAYGPDKIVKLYLSWCKPEWVDDEFRTARIVQSLDIPVPHASEVVEINGRRGIVYEFINGRTMLSTLSSQPWTLFKLARMLAEGHAAMHRNQVEGTPSLKRRLRHQIMQLDDKHVCELALAALETLPDGQAPCHGDYHPDNVILSGDRLVIIDWMNASIGHPLADVARTLLMLNSPYIPPEMPVKPVIRALRHLFHDAYLKHYIRLTGAKPADINQWIVPVAAARLIEQVPGERDYLLKLLR